MPRNPLATITAALVPVIATVATDPRKLKPGQACRLLNSTPLGPVIDDRRLRRHREQAGLAIGDGKTIDLLRYAGWLAVERHHPAPPPAIDAVLSRESPIDPYLVKRETERNRNAAKSRQGRDVGPIPACVNPKRRAAAGESLRRFAETYFARHLFYGWSDDLLEAIAVLEQVVRQGARFALAMPRGGGKSTLVVIALLWAVLYGHRGFAVGIAANKEKAEQLLDNVKAEILTNELLFEDFPEAMQPFRALECIAQRANGQHVDGVRTFIKWRRYSLTFPTVAGSKCSGALLYVSGLSSAIRGLNVESRRPDLALLDDIQTDQSARNPYSVTKRLGLIDGAVMGLAGPGKSIAVYAALTIIQPNDVAAQLTDFDKRPEFNGRRFRLLHAFPTNLELWRQYWEVRQTELRSKKSGDVTTPQANQFYLDHFAEMNAGAEVAWEARKLPTDVTSLQHAMNLYFANPRVFLAEYQNDPEPEENGGGETIDLKLLATNRTSGRAQRRIPNAATIFVAHVDVQHELLYYTTFACDRTMTGTVPDYGCWPPQKPPYFLYREAHPKLSDRYPDHEKKAAVRQGLIDLLRDLKQRRWIRDDETHQVLELVLVDWSDGGMADVVGEVCKLPEFETWAMPAEGRGIGPKQPPMDQFRPRDGEEIGHHIIASRRVRKGVRCLVVDSNYWKTHTAEAITAPIGNRGSISLFGGDDADHRMLFDHYTAESAHPTSDETTQRKVTMWFPLPNRDNHFWDNLHNCCAAACFRGAKVVGSDERVKKRLKLSEIQARRRR